MFINDWIKSHALSCPHCGNLKPEIIDVFNVKGITYRNYECGDCGGHWLVKFPVGILNDHTHILQRIPEDVLNGSE